jgi:hypothetical protein
MMFAASTLAGWHLSIDKGTRYFFFGAFGRIA